MGAIAKSNIDYRLLNRLSNLVICSSCLRRGKVTPVPQVISDRHSVSNECSKCRFENVPRGAFRQKRGKVLPLAR